MVDERDPTPWGKAAVDVETAGWIALALETIFGWFGILGIGHAYAGRLARGVVLLIAWWLGLALLAALSVVTLGLLACLAVPVWLAVPVISGLQARRTVLSEGGRGSWATVLGLGGLGCLGVLTVFCLLAAAFGLLGALGG